MKNSTMMAVAGALSLGFVLLSRRTRFADHDADSRGGSTPGRCPGTGVRWVSRGQRIISASPRSRANYAYRSAQLPRVYAHAVRGCNLRRRAIRYRLPASFW
jgi:hypothetical protein